MAEYAACGPRETDYWNQIAGLAHSNSRASLRWCTASSSTWYLRASELQVHHSLQPCSSAHCAAQRQPIPKPKAPEQLRRRFVCLRAVRPLPSSAFVRARPAEKPVWRRPACYVGVTRRRSDRKHARANKCAARARGAVLGADVGSPGADVAAPGAAEQTTGDAHTRAAVMPSASVSASALASSIGTDSSTGQTCRRAPAPGEYREYP
jgi:hypothetical protein